MNQKISIYIDGYNLYHHIDSYARKHNKHYLKWVNPFLLAKEFERNTSDVNDISAVHFFTALPHHMSKDIQARYINYKKALLHYGVNVVEGQFKKKNITVTLDNGETITKIKHEEKETDVNIALAVLADAYEKTSDKIYIITNDSDIAPAIRAAKKARPKLIINVLTPPLEKGRKANFELLEHSDNKKKKFKKYNAETNKYEKHINYGTRTIKERHLVSAIMPSEITTESGETIMMPEKYKKPGI